MQISICYAGQWRVIPSTKPAITIGRPNNEVSVDLDLSPDTTVSRLHAKVSESNGAIWIEDMGSKYGTLVNGAKITSPTSIQTGDTINIGETLLRIEQQPMKKKT